MTSPKNTTPKEADQASGADDPVDTVGTPAETAGEVKARVTTASAPAGRKPPGSKDVPAFEWKLMGESHGVELTLFKAVERAEVEAQLERVRRESYYRNLRILDAKEKVAQPAGAKARTMGIKDAPAKTTSKARPSASRAKKAKSATKSRSVVKVSSPTKTAKPAKRAKATKAGKSARKAKVTKETKTPKETRRPKAARTTKATRPTKAAKAKAPTKPASKKGARAKSTKKRATRKKK